MLNFIAGYSYENTDVLLAGSIQFDCLMNEAQVLGAELETVTNKNKLPVLFDREDVFYSKVAKVPAEVVSNRAMRAPIELRPGGYSGHFNPDNGDLGAGDGSMMDKATIQVVHLKHAVQWTKLAEWVTDDKRKAVIDAMQYTLAKAMEEFSRFNDSLCMQAGNGVLGTISAVSTTTLTNDTLALGTDGFGARLLRFGQKVNIYDTTLATQRNPTEAKIIGYDLSGKSVVLDVTVTGITAGDKIVVSGLTGASPVSLFGVPYHNTNASTGTWLGFNRSTTPEVRATRVSAAGALAISHPRLAINKISDRIGLAARGKTLTAWMHPCQKQAYEALGQLVQMITQTGDSRSLDLYFGDNMKMAGAPVAESNSWDKTRIDLLTMGMFGRAEMYAPKFYEVGGRKVFEMRGASGGVQTSSVSYIVAGWNLFARNPAAMAYIDGLTVPSGY